MTIFLIAMAILVIAIAVIIIKHLRSCSLLKTEFAHSNVIVFGKKGKGKDLLFQKVINLRKDEYYSNVDYGGEYNHTTANALNLGTNTYENFIKGTIQVIDKSICDYENKDFYFSDGGIILPSQYDNILHKNFKSFPISYALSRHLWHNNIHVNTQNLERVWKALREQADFFIKCNRVWKLPFGLFLISYNTYDKYTSAQQELNPMPNHLWNNLSKIEREKYIAMNGQVEKRFIFITKKHIYYDTRIYHKFIFGMTADEYNKKH